MTQLNLKKQQFNLSFCNPKYAQCRPEGTSTAAGYHENMIGRTHFGADQVTQLNLVLYNTIKSPGL